MRRRLRSSRDSDFGITAIIEATTGMRRRPCNGRARTRRFSAITLFEILFSKTTIGGFNNTAEGGFLYLRFTSIVFLCIFGSLLGGSVPYGGRFPAFAPSLAPAMLTTVTMRAWRTSTVAMRPRMPMRTCRRLTTLGTWSVCVRLSLGARPRLLLKNIRSSRFR